MSGAKRLLNTSVSRWEQRSERGTGANWQGQASRRARARSVCSHYGERPNCASAASCPPCSALTADACIAGPPTSTCRSTWRSPAAPNMPVDWRSRPERRLPRRRRARLALGDRARGAATKAVIVQELLADLDDQQQGASVHFDNTESSLGP